jgi:hypothetical protein
LLKAEKYRALYLYKELLDDSFPCGKIVELYLQDETKNARSRELCNTGSFATFTGSLTGKVRADMLLKLRQMKPVTSTT